MFVAFRGFLRSGLGLPMLRPTIGLVGMNGSMMAECQGPCRSTYYRVIDSHLIPTGETLAGRICNLPILLTLQYASVRHAEISAPKLWASTLLRAVRSKIAGNRRYFK